MRANPLHAHECPELLLLAYSAVVRLWIVVGEFVFLLLVVCVCVRVYVCVCVCVCVCGVGSYTPHSPRTAKDILVNQLDARDVSLGLQQVG